MVNEAMLVGLNSARKAGVNSARNAGIACAVSAIVLLASVGRVRSDEPTPLPPAATVKVDFDQHIAPIFKTRCFSCHGPNKQESGFRLDQEASARKGGDLGEAYIPGDSANSPLVQYVAGADADIVMPPKGDRLTKEQVGLLRAWIDQGAKWSAGGAGLHAKKPDRTAIWANHWAFKCPVRPALPAVKLKTWPRNPIDYFALARMERDGLSPAPEADRLTLIRRLSLDLTGLPPTIDETRAFVDDRSPDAYEKLVERLLASPHYGERWALWWLDAARYADTNGYEVDRPRSIWPYRDWVINAFNADMPFDEFTVEQMAGDMLPGATLSQRIATGFHRNTYMNEEGGHNWEQFRWESIVDRVHTTSTVFLGLTMACAQCHDHKYDPISQREYYEFFAFLNDADEPHCEATQPKIAAERAAILAQIAQLEGELETHFPPTEDQLEWKVLQPARVNGTRAEELAAQSDGYFTVTRDGRGKQGFQIAFATDLPRIEVLRIEATPANAPPLKVEEASAKLPVRKPDQRLILVECRVMTVATKEASSSATAGGAPTGKPMEESTAVAIREMRDGFGHLLTAALSDGDRHTGWCGIQTGTTQDQLLRLDVQPQNPIALKPPSKLLLELRPGPGAETGSLRFRLSAGVTRQITPHPELPLEEQRRLALATKFDRWRRQAAADARHWTVLEPVRWSSKNDATLSKLDDGSLLASGDRPEIDTYEVAYRTGLKKITGLKLEALPDASLPEYGPGRGSVMDDGTFMLSEFVVGVHDLADQDALKRHRADRPVRLRHATATYAYGKQTIDLAIDGEKLTGWHVKGGAGRRHCAVFEVAEPLVFAHDAELDVTYLQNFVHQQTLGRFRLWATSDETPLRAVDLPVDVEETLAKPIDRWTPAEESALKRYYLRVAPELASEHRQIDELRDRLPKQPTTLVLQERTTPRTTHQHVRGEFTRPAKEVTPDVPHFLHPLPEGAPRNRLTLAHWLVDEKNPLVGRVIMNRIWQAYFGRGLVTTPEDFGTQGALPSHPELLDWLARELMDNKWSLKHMHRAIVTSAVYRQSSATTPEKHQADPENILLARGPRFRLDAETIRDVALAASGLLNPAIGGPSVFPPQPDGVSDLAFGSFRWPTSKGPDRYRRGLYTFRKRATPYPAFAVFDAPQQSTCTVKRVRSNTPLQALSLLNDEVIVETAQAVAKRVVERPASDEEKLRYMFQRCLTRPPGDEESTTLLSYLARQRQHFSEAGVDVAQISGAAGGEGDRPTASELAAWTMVARVLLNLDETVTKE
jgi:Protein of unknown function (DUF1553)/Protein of unknown function (DUF1549)/Planctomycete cytochrome C